MPNQPETNLWELGVFQLETSTPVRGGPGGESNAPLLHLANRTVFLRSRVDALEAEMPLKANLASPIFTGTPRAPTPAASDATTRIPTTEWVRARINAALILDIAPGGSINLTSDDAANSILILTGTLTSNATVTIPAATVGRWTVVNLTAGAFTVSIRLGTGTAIAVAQNLSKTFVSSGAALYEAPLHLTSPTLDGTPTAPTQAATDNSTRIATTAYARRFARGLTSLTPSGGQTITLSDSQAAAPVIRATGSPASGFTIVFPAEAGNWTVINDTGQNATLRTSGQSPGITLGPNRTVDIATDGTNCRLAQTEGRNLDLPGATTADTPSAGAAGREVVTAEWVRSFLAGQALYTTGDFKLTLKASPDPGWLFLDGRTIGNAASGATARAHADTEALFALLWNNLSQANAPVSGGRGASAAADFAAGKTITLPDCRGRALVGAGTGTGLTNRILGSTWGTETHALSLAELAQHNHGGTTGQAGSHGHSLTINPGGAHTHTATSSPAGAHGHAAAASSVADHTHAVPEGEVYSHRGSPGPYTSGDDYTPNIAFWSQTSPAGGHSHVISLADAPAHEHGVSIGTAADHTHTGSIGTAGDHAHSIPSAGDGTPHPNMQPSIAFNVMVKL